jgi:hypothetical protein
MDGALARMADMINKYINKFRSENLKERNSLEDLSADERI